MIYPKTQDEVARLRHARLNAHRVSSECRPNLAAIGPLATIRLGEGVFPCTCASRVLSLCLLLHSRWLIAHRARRDGIRAPGAAGAIRTRHRHITWRRPGRRFTRRRPSLLLLRPRVHELHRSAVRPCKNSNPKTPKTKWCASGNARLDAYGAAPVPAPFRSHWSLLTQSNFHSLSWLSPYFCELPNARLADSAVT